MKPHTRLLIDGILILLAALILYWLLRPVTTPTQPIEQTKQSRAEDIKRAEKNEALSDTVYATRWKIKTKYDTLIKDVIKFDSTLVSAYYDSLVQNKKYAVVLFYKHQSCSTELVVMDSVHTLDSLVKVDLKLANIKADTIIASLENANDSLTKQCRKSFWKGFKWGFGTGAVVGGAAVGAVR